MRIRARGRRRHQRSQAENNSKKILGTRLCRRQCYVEDNLVQSLANSLFPMQVERYQRLIPEVICMPRLLNKSQECSHV